MKTYSDGSGGITRASVEWFQRFVKKHKNFVPVEMDIMNQREPTILLTGKENGKDCLLEITGCNCGYPGEGPRGTVGLLWTIAGREFEYSEIDWYETERDSILRTAIASSQHICFYFSNDDIEWDRFDGTGRHSLGISLLLQEEDEA